MNMLSWKLPGRFALALGLTGLAVSASLTWQNQQRLQTRRELLSMRESHLRLARNQFNGLKHQFTPGYKPRHLFRPSPLLSQGEIFKTLLCTHLAIHGQGFFAVSRGGVTRYTRDGQFEFRGTAC